MQCDNRQELPLQRSIPVNSAKKHIIMELKNIILSTTHFIIGYEITEQLGICRGSTVRARNVGRDILAGLKNIVGGEIEEYTKLLAMSREQALQRMVEDAAKMGADAVINVKFMTSQVMQGAAEMLAYGTAVKVRKA
jgi:uncharacterized protein YbjQ (UPF0145 family)